MWEPGARKIHYIETIDGREQLYNIAINFKRCVYLVHYYHSSLDATIEAMNDAFKDKKKYHIYKIKRGRWRTCLAVSILIPPSTSSSIFLDCLSILSLIFSILFN